MLGRYVAGTLLILGVTMLVAPEREENAEPQVARADTAPMALAATTPVAEPVRLIDEAETEGLAAPTPIAVETMVATAADTTEGTERVTVTLSNTQIGGIAALAGLEPAPAPSTPVTEASATPEPTVQVSRPTYHYVTGNRVNVRSGPSTEFRVIGRAVRGDSVEILSRDGNGWAEVRLLGTDDIGYMSADFLAADLNG